MSASIDYKVSQVHHSSPLPNPSSSYPYSVSGYADSAPSGAPRLCPPSQTSAYPPLAASDVAYALPPRRTPVLRSQHLDSAAIARTLPMAWTKTLESLVRIPVGLGGGSATVRRRAGTRGVDSRRMIDSTGRMTSRTMPILSPSTRASQASEKRCVEREFRWRRRKGGEMGRWGGGEEGGWGWEGWWRCWGKEGTVGGEGR